MSKETIIQIFLTIGIIQTFLPAVLGLLHFWWKYTTRTNNENVIHKIYKYIWCTIFKMEKEMLWDGADTFLCFSIVHGLLINFLIFILCIFTIHVGTIGFVIIGITLSLIFLPRIFVDVLKGLQYNRTTGNAERIDRLEKELEQLRNK